MKPYQSSEVQGSASPLTVEAASLIEKETEVSYERLGIQISSAPVIREL